jgi:hypothetical protein
LQGRWSMGSHVLPIHPELQSGQRAGVVPLKYRELGIRKLRRSENQEVTTRRSEIGWLRECSWNSVASGVREERNGYFRRNDRQTSINVSKASSSQTSAPKVVLGELRLSSRELTMSQTRSQTKTGIIPLWRGLTQTYTRNGRRTAT